MSQQIKELMLVFSDSDSDSIESSSGSDDEQICEYFLKQQLLLPQALYSKKNERKRAKCIKRKDERTKCIKKYIEQELPLYSEQEFKTHFRLNKTTFKSLCEKFEASEIFQNLRQDKRRTAEENLYVFLWFAGHKACSYRELGNRFSMCIATVGKIIDRVTKFFCSIGPSVIKWPEEENQITTSSFLLENTQFPNVIGAIDSTHIYIDPPVSQKDDYIDRNGNVSLCLQAICDETKKFTSIFVGFPGSSDDSWVFQNSFIYPKLQNLCGEYYILGDSGYPCMENLLTPYSDDGHLTKAQMNFNMKLRSCRVIIDNAFEILKQRFRQLYYCKLKGIPKLCDFITACCVLHNLCNVEDFAEITKDETTETTDADESYFPPNEIKKGKEIRDKICKELA